MNHNQREMGNHDQEFSRKRRNSHEFQITSNFSSQQDAVDNDHLALSLALPSSTRSPTLSPVQSPHHAPPALSPPPPPPPPPAPPCVPLLPFLPPVLSSSSFFPQHSSPLYLGPPRLLLRNTYVPEIPTSPPPAVPVNQEIYRQELPGPGPSSRRTRLRRSPSQAPKEGNSETIPAPYPWATDRRATIHKLSDLRSKNINKIMGQVQCKRCEKKYEMEFDLEEKFNEVGKYVAENKDSMHDRAPGKWMNPVLPSCKFCEQENCVKPIISEEKESINWLFLLLGEMIGLCKLDQLKYFCEHTKNHRTGAKDRLVYLTYLGLCKQLVPDGPFDR